MSDEYHKPLPSIRKIDEPYWEGTKLGELRLQHCNDCEHWWSPPEEFCPNCLGTNYAWEASRGEGTVWSRIFMHQVYYKAFATDVPYNIVWVKLDEGPMITSNVVDEPKEAIVPNRRVQVWFDHVTSDLAIPRFRLA